MLLTRNRFSPVVYLLVFTFFVNPSLLNKEGRTDRFTSDERSVEVDLANTTFPVNTSIVAPQDTPLGRGVHGAIPLQLIFEAPNLLIETDHPQKSRLAITVRSKQLGAKNSPEE